jgi:hypothetical protein
MKSITKAIRRYWERIRFQQMKRRALERALEQVKGLPSRSEGARHSLPGTLIVSMTSYPARFQALQLTLKCLMNQTIRPDLIILWIAREEMSLIPDSLQRLQGADFIIRGCDDLRSYNKLVHTLREYPEAFVITVDDDVMYETDCIERLVRAYDAAEPTIVCRRAHRPTYSADGKLNPYRDWQRRVDDAPSELPSADLFPTGVGGVLYPPGSLPPATLNTSLMMELCPTCDDSWFFFHGRQAGSKVKRAPGPSSRPVEWPSTQAGALRAQHEGGRKDEQLQALCRHFGLPRELPS